ncbi:MAG: hypothetical protein IKC49_02880 [Clostridia bacterium]|nr:hypothetical protein [Clostridia bacterium]
MRIAVDFDKTLFDCDSRLYQVMNHFLPTKSSFSLSCTPLNHIEDKDNLLTKLYRKLFYFTNIDRYTEYDNAMRTINELKAFGHDVIILSSRPNYQLSTIPLKDMAKIYNIDEKKIIINCNNKIQYCKMFKIDLIIDNDIDICREAIKQGVDAICFSDNHYRNVKTNNSWDWILKYLSSQDISVKKF